ncbi:MAG: hypothetical protein FJW34_22935 [Acidobacteria bacterium]|nr:hypothetical protein [Acidobacteriota bacterium]
MKTLSATLSLLLPAALPVAAQPVINPGGVVNAASYIRSGFPNSGIAQGSLFVVFGRDLGPAELRTFPGLPKPTSLAGTSVRVSSGGTNVDAFLYYTSSSQVAAILPSNTPLGEGTVTVTYNNVASPPASIRVVRSAPGIFTRNQVGHGQAVLQNVVSPTVRPLNEVTEAAQPGQAAVLWATGLGPIGADDAGAPPVGNVSADVEVLVGNRPVRPFYYGRSGSFPGIDQINFMVPAGVEGCRVPVAVKVDGVVGNYASMAIAASGNTCSDPVSLPAADMERLRQKQDGKAAWILLQRLSATLGSQSIRQDEGSAEIVRGNLAGMLANGTLAGSVAAPALGTCTVYTLPEPGDQLVVGPEHPDYRQQLDAGPALSLAGPQGRKYLFRGLYRGYEAVLGGGTLPEYLVPGPYGVDNGSGGTGLGRFEATLNLPPPLTWTNEAQINDVPRTADLTVTWSGGDPERQFVIIAGVAVNTITKAQASFVCSERVAAGRFAVPASVLASLPASSEWTGAGVPSALGVASQPLVAGTAFTAPGLDLGLLSYLDIRIKPVHYRDGSLAWPGAAWSRVESLEKAGWSRDRLNIARAFSDYIGSTAVMIVEGGLVVDEWGETATRYWLYSIWKSVLSALYGAPVHDGRIRLDQTLAELGIDDIPPSLTPEEKQATVRQLLQARSGVYHAAVADTPDVVAVRPPRGSFPPGTHWYYNNWDVNVLGAIFERAAGRGFFEEVKRRIAEPIQMEDFRLEDGYYERGPASIHPAYPMRMTARDLARFGLLCLRQGQWRGQQILPREWLRESMTSYSDAGPAGGYGYLWWVSVDGRHFPGVTVDEGTYSARGMYGQFLVIIPRRDLVVVHRVNRGIPGREVGYTQFGRLLRMILEARTTGAPGHDSVPRT